MRKTLITTAVSAALMLGACSEQSADTSMTSKTTAEASTTMTKTPAAADNVLLTPSPLQYMAPQFDKLKAGDYLPAFEQGMLEHKAEIAAITNNTEAATFDNTIVALEQFHQC
jgi:peptidyl-dipeptidase Dcp